MKPLAMASSLLMMALGQNQTLANQQSESSGATLPHSAAATLGPGFKDHYSQIGDVRIHYVMGGTGPAVLLVPGWPETWWAWRNEMPELAKHFTVIAVDTRGMGESSRPISGYDMASVAGDLYQLMVQLKYPRFRMVGHDIGVWISYAMAVDHPNAVITVAMIDSNIPGVTSAPPIFRSKVDNTHSWHFMFNQLDDLPELLVSGRERQYLSWIFSNYAYIPGAVAAEEYIRAYSVPGAMRAGFAYYRALPETIAQNEVRMRSRLAMPVLAIGGEFGTASVAEDTLRPYADHLEGRVIAGCGHYVPEECPVDLLDSLVPFLFGSK
jgi:pimeloyl-ACP methyl ester carboxylesterase